jgi:hypothetical protein
VIVDQKEKFVCRDCVRLKKCREPLASWVFFFVALLATVAIRVVGVLDFSPVLAKTCWYIGVAGFFVFFLYKYRYVLILKKEIKEAGLTDKLLEQKPLDGHDYSILSTILCQISSIQDKINYFFIFFTSGLALLFGIYIDIFRR